MSTASRFASFVKNAAIAAAIVLVAAGSVLPSTALAQQQPQPPPVSTWPPGAPALSGQRGATTPLSSAEIQYFYAQIDVAIAAGRQDAAYKTSVEQRINACQNPGGEDEISCIFPATTWEALRNEYIDVVLANYLSTLPACTTTQIAIGDTDNCRVSDVLPGTGDDTGGTGDPTTPTGDGSEEPVFDNERRAANNSCSLIDGNLLDCLAEFASKMLALVAWAFTSLFGWMLGVVGMFFNWVMLVTVFQYGTYFGNSAGLLIAWSVLRDLGNIMLLFGFIFIGLQTILNIGHFSMGRALARLVIFAILINFSLFVSSAIVDISNTFAASFYNIASSTGEGADCTRAENNEQCVGYGIAGKVLQAAGITAVFSIDGMSKVGEILSGDGYKALALHAGTAIFLVIMMVTLGAAAIMLVIRAIVLMLLLVVSPLGFAGMAIPQFEEQSKKWWSMLISQSFFAPIYILMVFVGLKIMEGAQATFNSGGADITTALGDTNVSTGGIFIIFALMVGFMIAAQNMAKSMGAVGASFAINTASKAVGGATMGTAGWVGRRTIGAGMADLGHRIEKSDWAKKNPGLGRMALGITDAGAHASFDARQAGVVKGAAKAGGLELGEPNKTAAHGIHGIHEKAGKDRENYDKRIKDAKAGAMIEETDSELRGNREKIKEHSAKARKDVDDQVEALERYRKQGASSTIIKDAEGELNRRLQTLAEKENELLSGYKVKNKDGTERDQTLAERVKELQARRKAWDGRGKADVNFALEGSYEASAHNPWNRAGAAVTLTMGPHADHEARDRIRKGGNLTDYERALDTLKNKFKESEEGGDDSGGAGGGHGGGAGGGHGAGGGGGHGHP